MSVDGEVGLPATEAVEAVRARLERALGVRGHRQGPEAASLVDERRRVTYHVSAEPSEQGSRVRVDVDVTQARAFRMLLVAATVTSTLLLAGMAYVMTPWLLAVAAIDAAIMGALIAHSRTLERAAVHDGYAQGMAAIEAVAARGALPPGDTTS
ncbi:MAG: hypothetical protein D6705_11480 [Deltaproteobacteria bacterium]|nr:MAG: hypothetical protein D6705_11480 [Deltaproteobacteria bacterium]